MKAIKSSIAGRILVLLLLLLQAVNRKMTVKAKNGKEYYLVEVIAHMLKYVKDELIRILRGSDLKVTATDFDWVITVPAIWKAKGKQMMREAGYKVYVVARHYTTPGVDL
jgi:molecular chaperone DnaK (HSP70)